MKRYLPIIFILIVTFSACKTRNTEICALIELTDLTYTLSEADFNSFCKKYEINHDDIYQWQNHKVIILQHENANEIRNKLEVEFPKLKVTFFEKPFYNYNREKLTGEKPASEWTHAIMTANLVQDTILQNEYMEYHRTQFEKWPELSKGFANADFQQLLVFRNGRQLMLVISIPKGKTLDELNPKTTENNPRVDEWNQIMAKYQEGIEDAPKGSTWVMFQKAAP